MEPRQLLEVRPGLQFMAGIQVVLASSVAMLHTHRWIFRAPKSTFTELTRAFEQINTALQDAENSRSIFECDESLKEAYGIAKEDYDFSDKALSEAKLGAEITRWKVEAKRLLKNLHTAQLLALNKHYPGSDNLSKLSIHYDDHDVISLQNQYNTAMAKVKYHSDKQANLIAEKSAKLATASTALQSADEQICRAKRHHYGTLSASLMEGVERVYDCFNSYKLSFDTAVSENNLESHEVGVYQKKLNETKKSLGEAMSQLWCDKPALVSGQGLFKKPVAQSTLDKRKYLIRTQEPVLGRVTLKS